MRARLAVVLLVLAVPPVTAQTLLDSWVGSSTEENFGRSVAFAGDVNGDGYDDVIVGAPFAAPLGLIHAGKATIFSGATGNILFTLNGAQAGERQGWAVAGIGDVNSDGHADVAVGVPFFNSSASVTQIGAVRVYSGATGAQLFQYVGPKAGDLFGYDVDGAGDWNGDGTPDVVSGAPDYDKLILFGTIPQAGYAAVISGAGPTLLNSYSGGAEHDNFGWSVAGAGDVNGGGMADIVVGAQGANTTVGYGGKAHVYQAELKTLQFTISGTQPTGSLGSNVDGGDFNNDGFSDIVVGAPFESGTAGTAHVFLGPSGTAGQVHSGSGSGDWLGYAVASVGDVDKDGWDDFAAGAYGSGTDNGYARVWSGKTATQLYSMAGQADGDHFGVALGGGGDLDADGWPDVAVGADLHDALFFFTDAGSAYVYDLVQHQTNVGFGGPGTALLDVYGAPLSAGKQADMLLSGAAPNRPATLYVSPGLNPIPFKGGLLAPDFATSIALGFVTDAQGKVLVTNIKGGGGPYDVYIQFVIKDPAQPKGFALSNTVKLHFLP